MLCRLLPEQQLMEILKESGSRYLRGIKKAEESVAQGGRCSSQGKVMRTLAVCCVKDQLVAETFAKSPSDLSTSQTFVLDAVL